MYDERLPRLILADGTILENSDCGYSDGSLFCWVKRLSLAEVFAIFNDPEKTRIIRFAFIGPETIYNDFTEMIQIKKKEDCIEVRLVGGTRGGNDDDPNDN